MRLLVKSCLLLASAVMFSLSSSGQTVLTNHAYLNVNLFNTTGNRNNSVTISSRNGQGQTVNGVLLNPRPIPCNSFNFPDLTNGFLTNCVLYSGFDYGLTNGTGDLGITFNIPTNASDPANIASYLTTRTNLPGYLSAYSTGASDAQIAATRAAAIAYANTNSANTNYVAAGAPINFATSAGTAITLSNSFHYNLQSLSWKLFDTGVGANIFNWQDDDHFYIGSTNGGAPSYIDFYGTKNSGNPTVVGFNLKNSTLSNATSIAGSPVVFQSDLPGAAVNFATTARNGDGIGNIVNKFSGVGVFTDGTLYYAGAWHTTNGSITFGIQEAINYYQSLSTNRSNPGGVHFIFDNGVYPTFTNIIVSCTNPFVICLDFAGKASSGIVYLGTTTQNVFTVQSPISDPECSPYMRNGFIASTVNGKTNIVDIEHPFGNIGIENMWIGYWPAMTNNQISGVHVGMTPPTTGILGLHANLIALNINADFSDYAYVHNCSFFEVQGVEFSPDHGVFDGNFFSYCGHDSDWPANSRYSLNASVYSTTQTHGDRHIENNDFYQSGSHPYYVNGGGNAGNSFETSGDTFEPQNTPYSYLLSPGTSILVVNPHPGGVVLTANIVTNSGNSAYHSINSSNAPAPWFNLVDLLNPSPAIHMALQIDNLVGTTATSLDLKGTTTLDDGSGITIPMSGNGFSSYTIGGVSGVGGISFRSNGSVQPIGSMDYQNTYTSINLIDPSNPQDAATKNYVDTQGFITSSALTLYALLTDTTNATKSVLVSSNYLKGNQTITLSGDATGSGTTAITTTLKNTGTAGTYIKTTFDAQGRETSGTGISVSDLSDGGNAARGNTNTMTVALAGNFQTINTNNINTNNATPISSGTLADARLSANVPLLNGNNVFTGSTNSFSGTNLFITSPSSAAAVNSLGLDSRGDFTTNVATGGGTVASTNITGLSTNTMTIVALNPVVGTLYTNTLQVPILVDGIQIVPTTALVAGRCSLNFINNGATNSVFSQVTVGLIGSSTGAMTNGLSGQWVTAGATYYWQDVSTGTGNSVALSGGSYGYVAQLVAAITGNATPVSLTNANNVVTGAIPTNRQPIVTVGPAAGSGGTATIITNGGHYSDGVFEVQIIAGSSGTLTASPVFTATFGTPVNPNYFVYEQISGVTSTNNAGVPTSVPLIHAAMNLTTTNGFQAVSGTVALSAGSTNQFLCFRAVSQ